VARILNSPLARDDLLDIWTIIAGQGSPSTADRFLGRIYGALDVLATAPFAGRERAEFPGKPRSFAVTPYVIFYEPLADGEGIAVWRVLHGARRMESLIRRPLNFE